MKKTAFFILAGLCFYANESFAQKRVPVQITIDSSFGTNGRIEVNTGGFTNEPTAFAINLTTKVTTVCGKVNTATAGNYHLGMIRVDSTGKLDPSFGTGGIVNAIWSVSDYANSMQPYTDNSGLYILAGAGERNLLLVPTFYRFKNNGTPDSSFGSKGRLAMPFDDHSSGEAVHVDISFQQYKVSGYSIASDASGKTGFAVMTLNWDGTLDSTFGVKGRMIIPALVHSVKGFFLDDRRFVFCGISDTGKRELVIGRFTENGIPDPTVGVNGLLRTGIILTGDTLMAQLEGGVNIVLLLPTRQSSSTQLTIRRFNEYGVADSSYGNKGIGKNGVGINNILPVFQPKGFYIGNDFSEIISGMTSAGVGNSIFVRISDTTASPDPTFNHNGIIQVDVDGGMFSNYLKFVQPIGKLDQAGNIKRFIGVGGSIHNGIGDFMVARFIGHPFSSVPESNFGDAGSLAIFPNPASSSFKIEIGSETIKNIRIVDALGREVMRIKDSEDAKEFSANATTIPNGIYYCIARIGEQQLVRKFIVNH